MRTHKSIYRFIAICLMGIILVGALTIVEPKVLDYAGDEDLDPSPASTQV